MIHKRVEKDNLLSQISNANQTPVCFDVPVTYAVNEKGAKGVKVQTAGYEKRRTTMVSCGTADGCKLPAHMICKRKTLTAWEVYPKNLAMRAHKNGWMTSDTVGEWVRLVWQRCTGALLRKDSLFVSDLY